MNDDLDIDEMLGNAQLATDPRLCPYCGQPYEVEAMLRASVRLADQTSRQAAGDSMTFSHCDKDGVWVIS